MCVCASPALLPHDMHSRVIPAHGKSKLRKMHDVETAVKDDCTKRRCDYRMLKVVSGPGEIDLFQAKLVKASQKSQTGLWRRRSEDDVQPQLRAGSHSDLDLPRDRRCGRMENVCEEREREREYGRRLLISPTENGYSELEQAVDLSM